VETHYLLDSIMVIYFRQKRSEAIMRRFAQLRPGEAAISVIAYGELLYGATKSSHPTSAIERLHNLIQELRPLPLPESAGETYGIIRADLAARGEMIGNNDLWIAAHAWQPS
jgi:tRNA(fMet)-specific endonuclease VapC